MKEAQRWREERAAQLAAQQAAKFRLPTVAYTAGRAEGFLVARVTKIFERDTKKIRLARDAAPENSKRTAALGSRTYLRIRVRFPT